MEIVMVGVCMLAMGFFLCFGLLKWNGIRYSRKGLPPGTMGWPVFGETTEFLRQGPDFMKHKRARYGSVFKSHILGSPTIVSMDPELNRYILLNEGKGLVPGYPQSALDILGKSNIAAVHRSDHRRIRGSFLSLVNPSMLKDQLLPKIDKNMRIHLHNLQGKTIDIQKITTNEEDPRYKLNDEEILDQVVMILYSGFETVSTTSMMAIKYLHDHPSALQEIRDEHFAIRGRKKPEEPLDWNDYKSMVFTRAVIFETSRLATVVNGVLRKTTEGMELNGYFIPRGWRIYVYTREINYDPFLYPEPQKFNPWRWLEKSLESHNYCFLFGGGSRLCPGKELGIVTIAIFLHYFVTRYRWEEVGEEKLLKFPRVEAPNGLHVRVSKY
ncbi:hypothetical protein RHGRI_027133 [Rhododendron griersonianum]|uniref:Cytochrome P450 85A n=1 Tax=Rhododendron griersonianum TaxID=479676 RepID=A0AAV6IYP9_9ERIC|nr:hypothetical protein RHGRI_027133 [Rhododendron griersonianum]